MSLKIQADFPKEDIRLAPDYAGQVRSACSFLAGVTKLLTSTVKVGGFANDGVVATLTIRYEEVYSPEATISGVMERAEQFARAYCLKLGIGAGEIKATQTQAAEFESTSVVNYEEERDHLLDIAATLTRDSLYLSRL